MYIMFSLLPSTLCLEVLEMIIDKLTVLDKTNLLKVNKEWNAFMEGNAQVWKHFDLDALAVSQHTCFDAISGDELLFDFTPLIHLYDTKTNSGVYRLRVSGPLRCDWKSLLSHNWQYLTELKIESFRGGTDSLRPLARCLPDLKRLDIGGDLTIDIAILFLENSLKLEYANFLLQTSEFRKFLCSGRISSRLQTLKIRSCPCAVLEGQRNFLKDLIRNALHLKDLSIHFGYSLMIPDLQDLSGLKRFSVSEFYSSTLLLPSGLEMLSINLNELDKTCIITPLPKLTELAVQFNGDRINMDGLYTLYGAIGPEVNTLDIQAEFWGTIDIVIAIIRCVGNSGQIWNIKSLTIGNNNVNGTLLEVIAAAFPKLESFTIDGGGILFTQDDIMAFVKNLPKLSLIDLGLEDDLNENLKTWLKGHNIVMR